MQIKVLFSEKLAKMNWVNVLNENKYLSMGDENVFSHWNKFLF